jgi:hypothetical protein
MAKKLRSLSRNLARAAKVATELGEQGMLQVLVASGANNPLEAAERTSLIANLQELALWSTRAAETAKQTNLSAEDHRGGRTPDVLLRSLVIMLMARYEFLLSVKATHTVDPATGLGHSTFDLFVKEAIRLYAPEKMNSSHALSTMRFGALSKAGQANFRAERPPHEYIARVYALDR